MKNPMIPCFQGINDASSKFRGNRQTDRQTHRLNEYCNPFSACAPRVNELRLDYMLAHHVYSSKGGTKISYVIKQKCSVIINPIQSLSIAT